MTARLFSLACVTALALGISGCDRIPGTKAFAIREAERRVSAQLIDPQSAVFSEVITYGAQHERVCGMVNGRNRMGGYAGPVRFVSTLSLTVIEPNVSDAEDYSAGVCLFEAATAFYCAEELGPAIATAGC